MDIEKCNVYIRKNAGQGANKMYVNEEINVSEIYPEIYNIVKEKTEVQVDKVVPGAEQVTISGYINYSILYYTNDSDMVYGMEGEIPFEETLRIGNTDENSVVNVKTEVENANIKLFNPRKFVIRAEISIMAVSENLDCVQFPEEVDEDSEVEVLNENIEALSIVADKTENFRVKETIFIPNAKPAADRLVWKNLKLKNISTKVMDEMVHVSGELYVFVMYLPEDSDMPNQWIETSVDFNGNLDLKEAGEELVSYIDVVLQEGKIHLNENSEGENRELMIDATLELNIKLYKEQQIRIIKDIYSPYKKIVPQFSNTTYQKLLVKNASRTKSVVKINLDQSKGNVLQICNSSAELKINQIEVGDNGLVASGKIKAWVMYISSDDKRPVCASEEVWDFEHRIDAEGITKDDMYYMNWRVEQVSASMISGTEIEVKAVVALEAIVFKNCGFKMIKEVEEEELDMETMNELPEIIGYVVQKNDALWNIAKRNFTTVSNIIKINQLEGESVKPGDRLLVMKSCKCK